MAKIRIYHFHNGQPGGVFAVICNLLKFSCDPQIENHIIYTINKDSKQHYVAEKPPGAMSEQVFYYSPKWNFYHTCRELATLLPDSQAIVIAHDWIELGMMSNLGLQNPVVQFLHGDYKYYYELAKKNSRAVDLFITVARDIAANLARFLPSRANNIVYMRLPVATIDHPILNAKVGNNIIFIGRPTIAKGFFLLPAIAEKLKDLGIDIIWHIVGVDKEVGMEDRWNGIRVKFYGTIPNDEVLQLLEGMKLLILPTLSEGMPIVVIEGMKVGVIPIVNDIDGGIQEIVMDHETGYKIPGNDVGGYVQKIATLVTDSMLTEAMKKKCISLSNRLFDPVINTKAIESQIKTMLAEKRRRKSPMKAYGSRLDQPWLGNKFTYLVRNKFTKTNTK